MMPRLTVVIPTIRNNALLYKSVEECLKQGDDVEIIVMTEEEPARKPVHPRVRFVNCGPLNMSTKRNIGARLGTGEFIAFTDSDAYPAPGWADHAIREWDLDAELGMVGGPELPPEGEPRSERYVGLASRSKLVTGSHSFRKEISPRRYFTEMSACNLFMRRQEYLDVGGMDESLYIGEDADLGRRIHRSGRKILFSPNVIVHHKNRSFVPFLIQRYARGMAISLILRSFLKDCIAKRKLLNGLRLEALVAPGFVAFVLTGLALPHFPAWRLVYWSVWALFLSVIALETRRKSERVSDYLGVYVSLLFGTLVAGMASFLSLLGIEPDISKYYRNRNDAK